MTTFSKLLKVERVVPNALAKTYARLCATCSTSSWDKPIHLMIWMSIPLVALISCESTNYVPPVTAEMATTGKRKHVDVAKLNQGRTLFVHRCIECHTLPALWHYTTNDWAQIVNDMSHRASLKPAERDAIFAYILAVRANER